VTDTDWLYETEDPVQLAERERAYNQGYSAGERNGYRAGGAEALRRATAFTTLLSDRRFRQDLEALLEFIRWNEGQS